MFHLSVLDTRENRIHPSGQSAHPERDGRDFNRTTQPGNPERGRCTRGGSTSLFPTGSRGEVYRRGWQAYIHPGQGRYG